MKCGQSCMQMNGVKLVMWPKTDVSSELSLTPFMVTHSGLTVVRVDNYVLTFLVTHPGLMVVRVDN